MGNGITTLTGCCTGAVAGEISRRYEVSLVHDGLGHSFCYIRPDNTGLVLPSSTPEIPLQSEPIQETTTTFRSISGASVSANPSTALSGTLSSDSDCAYSSAVSASAFESSGNFASLPLQPVPRGATWQSGPIVNESGHGSAPFERRFLSGPIESGLYSGPIEPTKKTTEKDKPKNITRKTSTKKTKSKKNFLTFKTLFTNLISNNNKSRLKKSVIEPINGSDSSDSDRHHHQLEINSSRSNVNPNSDHEGEVKEEERKQSIVSVLDVQWAQGKAGEDRVHVVVSEENGWVFVGIYDGFNGPDAPDYLLNNLYIAVQKELNELLLNDEKIKSFGENGETLVGKCSYEDESCSGRENFPGMNSDAVTSGARNQEKSVKWRCEWENMSNNKTKCDNDQKESNSSTINHNDVLKALLHALRKTEDAYLELADLMVTENPELALMGSCVLVTLMKGEDVYVMNVGDSRAVLGRKPNLATGRKRQKELERIREDREMLMNGTMRNSLIPLQLNMEHSTKIEEVNKES